MGGSFWLDAREFDHHGPCGRSETRLRARAIGHATDAPPRSVMNSWERKLRPGEDHLRAAKELLLQKYNAGKKGSDFNRPLRYPPSGVA